MNADGQSILRHLEEVAQERRTRAERPSAAEAVRHVKAYQHARFERCYADLLASARYGAAARFFLEDLYGPRDFGDRDAQFARIVPALVRLFSAEIVGTVARLAELHALSERLDGRMADELGTAPIDASRYAQAWQRVGHAQERFRQIRLMLEVGQALDRYTRRRALRHSLRLMRMPARAAGLQALHTFLERGFDTFGGMNGAEGFLSVIVERETRLAESLFAADGVAQAARVGLFELATRELGQVP